MKRFLCYILLPFFSYCLCFAQSNPKAIAADKLDKKVRQQFNLLLDKYFEIKDALIETNDKKARLRGTQFLEALSKVDDKLMTPAQQIVFTPQQKGLQLEAARIQSAKGVETQRAAFEKISESMLMLLEAFRSNDIPVYKQYCPMAFDNKGAYWLSDEKTIRNPYFGDKMLHCGSVKASF
jgi:Cu(I)/Ag(I) efflux system membrane fusion protein